MKYNIYSKSLFVIDLILVSVWAFFLNRYCSADFLLLVPIRIALCFEMRRKSSWTLFSAIAFFIAYLSLDFCDTTFVRMIYKLGCCAGSPDVMVAIFENPIGRKLKVWFDGFTVLWFLWLIGMPLFVGWRQKAFGQTDWRKKGIWLYLLPLVVLCVWRMVDEGKVGGLLLGVVLASCPLAYWGLYLRKGRSLMQLISDGREVGWYVGYAAFMLFALIIGLKDISALRFVGLILLLPLFYIMLMKSLAKGVILTRCCVALSFAGWGYWLICDNGRFTVSLLCISITLIVYVGITMILKTREWLVSIILMTVIPTVIAPFILGFNPYVVTDADYTYSYLANICVKNGVYVVEKYTGRDLKEQSRCSELKLGLRDRYGIILPMEYDSLKIIDEKGRFLSTYSNVVEEGKKRQQYGIFDLKKRFFVLDPYQFEAPEIEKIDDATFKLINADDRHYTTLYLPGEYKGKYFPDAHYEPHFADSENPVDEYLAQARDVCLDVKGTYWERMRTENPHVYKLMIQIYDLAAVEGSPMNDLNYARAIKRIIDSDYNGDVDKALQDVADLSYTLTYGSQSHINMWTDYIRLISSIHTSLAYDSMLSAWPDNEWIFKEYVAWHNLLEAMFCYLDYLYGSQIHQSVPEEKNEKVTEWLDYRRECLEKERDILTGKLLYSVEQAKADSIRNYTDFEEFFSKYHHYSEPYYYHAMWYELKFALDEWAFARTKIAEGLGWRESLSYREYSKEVVDGIFSAIEELDWRGFQPAKSDSWVEKYLSELALSE